MGCGVDLHIQSGSVDFNLEVVMVANILILGHSFISRLVTFNSLQNHHSVDMNMGLNPTQEQILYMGYPGGHLNIIKTEGLQYVQMCNPDIMVLQIGSNDLCKETNEVHDVAKGIIEVAMSLRFKYNMLIK